VDESLRLRAIVETCDAATTAGATTSPNSHRLADGATIQFAVVLDVDRRGHICRRAVRPDVFAPPSAEMIRPTASPKGG
jgi:hypothetical protein